MDGWLTIFSHFVFRLCRLYAFTSKSICLSIAMEIYQIEWFLLRFCRCCWYWFGMTAHGCGETSFGGFQIILLNLMVNQFYWLRKKEAIMIIIDVDSDHTVIASHSGKNYSKPNVYCCCFCCVSFASLFVFHSVRRRHRRDRSRSRCCCHRLRTYMFRWLYIQCIHNTFIHKW